MKHFAVPFIGLVFSLCAAVCICAGCHHDNGDGTYYVPTPFDKTAEEDRSELPPPVAPPPPYDTRPYDIRNEIGIRTISIAKFKAESDAAASEGGEKMEAFHGEWNNRVVRTSGYLEKRDLVDGCCHIANKRRDKPQDCLVSICCGREALRSMPDGTPVEVTGRVLVTSLGAALTETVIDRMPEPTLPAATPKTPPQPAPPQVEAAPLQPGAVRGVDLLDLSLPISRPSTISSFLERRLVDTGYASSIRVQKWDAEAERVTLTPGMASADELRRIALEWNLKNPLAQFVTITVEDSNRLKPPKPAKSAESVPQATVGPLLGHDGKPVKGPQ